MGEEEGNMHEETKDLVIPSNLQKKGERIVFIHPNPKGFLKENSLLSDFSPNTIMNVPKLLPL